MPPDQAPLVSRPPNLHERFMQERFSEAIAEQSQLMDGLAQRLLSLELAIPSLYALVLKAISGTEHIVLTWGMAFAFSCWFIAIILTLIAMIPHLDNNIVRDSPDSIEAFFDRAARRKWFLLMPAVVAFISGVLSIILDILL